MEKHIHFKLQIYKQWRWKLKKNASNAPFQEKIKNQAKEIGLSFRDARFSVLKFEIQKIRKKKKGMEGWRPYP